MPEPIDLDVWLDSVDHLFVAPPVDHFSEYQNPLSGIEFALAELKSRRLADEVHLRLHLPAEECEPGIEDRLHAAVARYCRFRIEYNQREIGALRRDGLGALWVGLLIFSVGLVLSTLVRRYVREEFATAFLADGIFLVMAWVGFWYPLDVLVYYGRPYKRESRVLRSMIDMRLEVVPYSSAPDGSPR